MSKIFLKSRYMALSGLCCSLLLLSACATIAPTESSIKERATARWNAILTGDLAGAYGYLSPGFRSSVSSLQYQRSILGKQVNWTGARYIGSECTESTCKVKISLDYSVYGVLPGVKSYKDTQTTDESWILVDGTWYLVPE